MMMMVLKDEWVCERGKNYCPSSDKMTVNCKIDKFLQATVYYIWSIAIIHSQVSQIPEHINIQTFIFYTHQRDFHFFIFIYVLFCYIDEKKKNQKGNVLAY